MDEILILEAIFSLKVAYIRTPTQMESSILALGRPMLYGFQKCRRNYIVSLNNWYDTPLVWDEGWGHYYTVLGYM